MLGAGYRSSAASQSQLVCYSRDGKRLATASRDGTVMVRDRATGREVHSLLFKSGDQEVATAWCVAMSPDGRRIVAGGMGKTAKVWDAETGQMLLELEHTNAVLSVAFSPDSKQIVAGAGWYGEPKPRPGEVKIWNAATGQLRLALQHPKPAWGVAISPDGQRIVTGSGLDGEVKLWDATTGREIFRNPRAGLPAGSHRLRARIGAARIRCHVPFEHTNGPDFCRGRGILASKPRASCHPTVCAPDR